MTNQNTDKWSPLNPQAIETSYYNIVKHERNLLAMKLINQPGVSVNELNLSTTDAYTLAMVEAHLTRVEGKLVIRTELPAKLQRVPFFRLRFLRKLLLRGYEFISREQRFISHALVGVWRDFLHGYRHRQDQQDQLISSLKCDLVSAQKDLQYQDEVLRAEDARLGQLLANMHSSSEALRRELAEMREDLRGLRDYDIEPLRRDFVVFKDDYGRRRKQDLADIQAVQDDYGRRRKQDLADIQAVQDDLKDLLQQVQAKWAGKEAGIVEQLKTLEAWLRARDLVQEQPVHHTAEPLPVVVGKAAQTVSLSAYYLQFENAFRGSQDVVRGNLQKNYTSVLAENGVGNGAKALDIGCGRGEWLGVLKDCGVSVQGIDINPVVTAYGQAQGLDIQIGDGLAVLANHMDASLDLVSAFHVIEHLSFEQLVYFLDEALRVLKPGGVLITETPNPENLIVGSCSFWNDPTHMRPLPPEPTRFLYENRGFSKVDILRLHSRGAVPNEAVGGVRELLERLYIGQDYALVAVR